MARVENPISWFRPKRHYIEFERFARELDNEGLVEKRRKYDHTLRNTSIITGLGLAAGCGIAEVLVPLVPEAWLAAGAITAGVITVGGVSITGATRHGLREGEKTILNEEIERRNLPQK